MKRRGEGLRKQNGNTEPWIDHRTEALIRATMAAITGAHLTLTAIAAQQTPECADEKKRSRRALSHFRKACRWARVSLRAPTGIAGGGKKK